MNNRTMIKLSASKDCITLRTFSKDCHSPQGFVLMEKELLELEEKRYMTVSDIHSFAKVSLRKSFEQAEILEIEFTWLSDTGGGKVSGRTETVRLSYKKFKSSIKQSREDSMQIKMLSLEESGRPKIEFQSRRNLKAVAETKALRKKLGKFMADISCDGKAAGRSRCMMILNRTAFSSGNRRPMGLAYAGESSSTAGRIWKRRTMGYIPDRRGQDKLWCKKQDTAVNMLSVLFFNFLLKKDVFNA